MNRQIMFFLMFLSSISLFGNQLIIYNPTQGVSRNVSQTVENEAQRFFDQNLLAYTSSWPMHGFQLNVVSGNPNALVLLPENLNLNLPTSAQMGSNSISLSSWIPTNTRIQAQITFNGEVVIRPISVTPSDYNEPLKFQYYDKRSHILYKITMQASLFDRNMALLVGDGNSNGLVSIENAKILVLEIIDVKKVYLLGSGIKKLTPQEKRRQEIEEFMRRYR